MRIVIESNDRIGISQEILAIFAKQTWNLKAVEIISCFTYVHVEYEELSLKHIKYCLDVVAGVRSVKQIDLLPSEQRENHLQALLDKIPEPIIDLDSNGIILAMNQASLQLMPSEDHREETANEQQENSSIYLGQSIEHFIEKIPNNIYSSVTSSQAINIEGKAYILDISPVLSSRADKKQSHEKNQLNGSVLLFRSMNTLGRQISLLQSHQEHSFDSIIGQSKSIRLIKEQGKRFADVDLPVLINGETGTGKELIARALHQASARAKSPFLAVNCSALPEQLLESELFGYASGAFTGAQKGGKPGLIELAEGGCLFLDEIAEMSPYLQAKLLRFLQDLTYRRVGGTKELTANVRILSASHQNLAKLIAKKTFREDLYYRLNVLSLELPPLRERSDDIELLGQFFIENAVKQVANTQEAGSLQPKLTKQAKALLGSYGWPGNIRQLQNVLFSVVALNDGGDISTVELQQVLSKFADENQQSLTISTDNIKDWSTAQANFEASLLKQLHPMFPTTRSLAQRLNVSHNKIAMKLREHGIS